MTEPLESDHAGSDHARQQRRCRRTLLRAAHPDHGGSAQAFRDVLAALDQDRPPTVRVQAWRRRPGMLGLVDDLRRARARRALPARVR